MFTVKKKFSINIVLVAIRITLVRLLSLTVAVILWVMIDIVRKRRTY